MVSYSLSLICVTSAILLLKNDFLQTSPGIRSEDLEDLFERTVRGSAIALSSPRLMIPVAIYGFWGLCHNFLHGFLDIEVTIYVLDT
ncbi:hypothetical protein Syun_010354 [Stephania yunnanensis]|uniref:Uncharacterized protein n=1 Tax=Stephania yunnanensis TaxID=152371 RepID=A0AAP0KHB1_9MAGN